MMDPPAWLDPNWLRAFHIISVIALIAGMVMQPRLYAYQTASTPGGEMDKAMIAAANRLRVIILNPSLGAAWIFGLLLLWASGWVQLGMGWMHAKLALVVGLSGLHGYYISEGRRLARGERRRSEKYWRMMSEAPFVVAILVVILAVVEPF